MNKFCPLVGYLKVKTKILFKTGWVIFKYHTVGQI